MNTHFGLGDLAYYLFRPGVYFYDALFGTDLKDCTKCKRRRKLWNSWFSLPRWVWISLVTIAAGIVLWRK